MPARSKAQARLMAAAAHKLAFAKKVEAPQSIAKEFIATSGSTKSLPQRVTSRKRRK